eukprot:TRINITY_DN13081_c2_g3_i1.p1 TRINITY_DN13081_c2_g3~~TRINITY_DN13081_c2_g3_i1.p1  ORF type:complete len:313 (+),score=25.22 TRINITY_DN13081_c2_g3_i1:85-1023(+)
MPRCPKLGRVLLFTLIHGSGALGTARVAPLSMLALDSTPICTVAAAGNQSGQVQVFAHEDNSRHLEFGNEWSGTQTSVRCKGALPLSCTNHFTENGSVVPCSQVDCPCERDSSAVDAEYLSVMVEAVLPLCRNATGAKTFRVLNIGLGGGDVPAFLLDHCPQGTLVESVEYDPRVVYVATRYFGTNLAQGRHKVHVGDGGAVVQQLRHSGQLYDAILIDVFDDAGDVPASCLGDAFTMNVRALLRPSGKVLQQVWERQHGQLLNSLKRQFGVNCAADTYGRNGQWVVVATQTSRDSPQAVGAFLRSRSSNSC